MKAVFKPSRLSGTVKAPQSKSIAIRLLFSSLLGNISLNGLEHSDDVEAAIRVMRAFKVHNNGDSFEKGEFPNDLGNVDLGGSGTVLRMLLPILACTGISATLTGDASLQKRPLSVLHDLFASSGVEMTGGHLPLKISGRMNAKEVTISGSESSQYISGFIFGLLLVGGGRISLLPPVRSSSYIQMTCDVLNSIGAHILYSGNEIHVYSLDGPLRYSGPVPGDFLLASFYAAGAVLTGGELKITDLTHPEWSRGDSRIAHIINERSGTGAVSGSVWTCGSGKNLTPFYENVGDSPDMAVSLAALAAGSNGKSEITGIELLGIKESDRLESISHTLVNYGCTVAKNGGLNIWGPERPVEGTTEKWNDHRIAMLGSILSLRAGGTVSDAESVSKSNPRFFDDLRRLGGDFRLI